MTATAYDWRLVPLAAAVRTALDTKTPQAHKPGAWRPHMERRKGETIELWNVRLSRSCYRCGKEFESAGPGSRLNVHEDSHG
ncbi:hypothetical protein [Saccharopolyspora shandongensis]|uniref:hypothetical protein n=1 Tax=Saccharopolyspora shandongensis TaxID=418495 RepID=UPI00340B598F